MRSSTQLISTVVMLLVSALLMNVQGQMPRVSTVNISAEAERVHIAAQGDVTEMRIEVSDEAGDVVFQSGQITGQQLDWKMTDSQGEWMQGRPFPSPDARFVSYFLTIPHQPV
jgi:hypothetical protein